MTKPLQNIFSKPKSYYRALLRKGWVAEGLREVVDLIIAEYRGRSELIYGCVPSAGTPSAAGAVSTTAGAVTAQGLVQVMAAESSKDMLITSVTGNVIPHIALDGTNTAIATLLATAGDKMAAVLVAINSDGAADTDDTFRWLWIHGAAVASGGDEVVPESADIAAAIAAAAGLAGHGGYVVVAEGLFTESSSNYVLSNVVYNPNNYRGN